MVESKRWALLLAGGAIVGAILAGCGSDDKPGDEPLDGTPGGCGATCKCPEVGTDTFTMKLPAHDNKEIKVPPPPTDLSKYAYATDFAKVSLPEQCKTQYLSNLTTYANLTDRQPDGRTGMAYLRIGDLEGGYDTLKEMLTGGCACGMVFASHGTGGPGWDTVSASAIFSAMGYLVVMPDSQAMPDSYGLKGKTPLKDPKDIDMTNWCNSYGAYEGSCYAFNKPMCYTSKFKNIIEDQVKYRKYVQRMYLIRKYEFDYFMDAQESLLKVAPKLFLFGNSEGGMAASRYYSKKLDDQLDGHISMSWSCEFNYFTPCAEESRVCEHKCRKEVPQLNIIGDKDEYFGNFEGSLGWKVANDKYGYGGPITGNCKAAFDSYGFTKATVVVLNETGHGPLYWNDNVWRSVMADFMGTPGAAGDTWKSLKQQDLCEKGADNVWRCGLDGPLTCTPEYEMEPNATWNFVSNSDTCTAKRRMGEEPSFPQWTAAHSLRGNLAV